jgi:hypothetical protein
VPNRRIFDLLKIPTGKQLIKTTMKKILYFMSMAAVVLAMASCKDKKTEEVDPGSQEIIPQRIAFADAFQEYFMADGETGALQYTVSPENVNVQYTLVWKSSDKSVVSVNDKGEVTANGEGTAKVTVSIAEYPDFRAAEATITVLAPAQVGEYIYDDGSWGSNANPSDKKVIAVIYWTGDASAFDPILEEDYPNCTHGLAMSLKQGQAGQWMKDFEYYFFNTDDLSDSRNTFMHMGNSPYCDNSGSLTEWGVEHSSYADKIRPYVENKELWAGKSYPGLGGYTYTAVLEEYTRTYPNANKYPFEFFLNAMKLVEDTKAPLTTSRWYVPSVYEAALMVNTALIKPSDFDNKTEKDGEGHPVMANNSNLKIINASLEKVSGADLLPDDNVSAIASATDSYLPFSSLFKLMSCSDFFEMNYVARDPNESSLKDWEVADINAEWDSWLKENAGENYEQYKAEAGDDVEGRTNMYLKIRGYDLSFETVIGARFTIGLSILPELQYANVGVADGMLHSVLFPDKNNESQKYYSGKKGNNNEKDVVRAIIAF